MTYGILYRIFAQRTPALQHSASVCIDMSWKSPAISKGSNSARPDRSQFGFETMSGVLRLYGDPLIDPRGQIVSPPVLLAAPSRLIIVRKRCEHARRQMARRPTEVRTRTRHLLRLSLGCQVGVLLARVLASPRLRQKEGPAIGAGVISRNSLQLRRGTFQADENASKERGWDMRPRTQLITFCESKPQFNWTRRIPYAELRLTNPSPSCYPQERLKKVRTSDRYEVFAWALVMPVMKSIAESMI